MLIKKAADIRSSEITDQKLYLNRREFLRATGRRGRGGSGVAGASRALASRPAARAAWRASCENVGKSPLSLTPDQEKPNTWEQITTYNNYYEFGTDKDSPSLTRRHAEDRAVDGHGRRRVREEGQLSARGPHQGDRARGAHLPSSLRRGLVDGDSVGRRPARRLIKKLRADVEGEVRRVLHARRSEPDAGRAHARPALAVHRRAADGRSDASADDSRGRAVRRSAAEAGRRAAPAGRALEVRLQGREVDRADPVRREAAAQHAGRSRRRRNTGSTRTSTRRSIIRAGARRASGASASSSSGRR